jgi:hypothetical protein
LEYAAGLARHVLHNAVAVPFLVGQGQQDMENRRTEWTWFVWCLRFWHEYIRYGYING